MYSYAVSLAAKNKSPRGEAICMIRIYDYRMLVHSSSERSKQESLQVSYRHPKLRACTATYYCCTAVLVQGTPSNNEDTKRDCRRFLLLEFLFIVCTSIRAMGEKNRLACVCTCYLVPVLLCITPFVRGGLSRKLLSLLLCLSFLFHVHLVFVFPLLCQVR